MFRHLVLAAGVLAAHVPAAPAQAPSDLARDVAALRTDLERAIGTLEERRAALAGRGAETGAEDALGILVSEIIFQPGDVTIDASARQRLAGVAETLQRLGTGELHVVGYSDRTGPADINAELALDRATEVSRVLNEAGLPSREIVTVSALEAGLPLPVPTPEGVAEPRNRSARIFVRPE